MGPFGAAALGGFIVLALDKAYDYWKKPKPLNPNDLPLVDPLNQPGVVSQLQKGRTYAVRTMFDVSKLAAAGTTPFGTSNTPDKDGASRYVRAIFEKAGFKVLGDPMPRSEAEASRFYGGLPSEWVFTGQWQKGEPYVDFGPDTAAVTAIFPNATFTILPVA